MRFCLFAIGVAESMVVGVLGEQVEKKSHTFKSRRDVNRDMKNLPALDNGSQIPPQLDRESQAIRVIFFY